MENEKKPSNETSWSGVEKFFATSVIQQAEKTAKRWFIAWLLTMAALISTNAAWIYVFNSYEYVYQNGAGENYYNNEIGGDVENGTTD